MRDSPDSVSDRSGSPLRDRHTAVLSWLLSSDLDGPILIVGRNRSSRPLELPWPGDSVQLQSDVARADEAGCVAWSGGPLPFPDRTFVALVRLPQGEIPETEELTRVLRADADVVSVGGPVDLPRSWHRWCLIRDGKRRLRLMSLDDDQAIRDSTPYLARRWRYLPLSLTRLLRSPEIFVSWGGGRQSRLQRILDLVCDRTPGRTCHLSPPLIQDKGKLTLHVRCDGNEAFLKLAATQQAIRDLNNARRVLDHLHAHLPDGHSLRKLLPVSLEHYEDHDACGWLELGCAGTPMAELESTAEALPLCLETADVVAQMVHLPAPAVPPLSAQATGEKDGFLRELAGEHGDDALATYDRVVRLLAARGLDVFLRKGDFSLSNVMAADGRISGLIDWDESGTTHHRLANLADFLFSWMWQREGLSREAGLPLLIAGELRAFDSGLDPAAMLARCGGDRRALALGALESWTDHVHHELKHAWARRNRDRVASLFSAPLARLDDALDGLEP